MSKRDGSNSTFLHTSGKSVAVIFFTFLCRQVKNPPFLHNIASWILRPSPHEQLTGKHGTGQPHRNLIESRNCCLFNKWSNSRISTKFSQFNGPVLFEMSWQRFILSFKAEADLGLLQHPRWVEHFVITVNGWKPLTIITKSSILDVGAVLDPSLHR